MRRIKVCSHGLADPARLQEARARWLGELTRQESEIARISRLGKLAKGTSVEARARWLGELAVQEIKLARVSRPGKVARGTSEVARRTCDARKRHERGGSANLRCKKVNSNGLADPARLQEARARWLGELAVLESKLARVSRPSKVARGTSEVALRTCGAGKQERGGSANLRCRKVSLHGLADPVRLQEARARWLGELALQENLERLQEARARRLGDLVAHKSKLARVSRPGKVARSTGEVARRTYEAGKKVSSHGLADRARLQGARARWLSELAVQENKLARVSRPAKVARGRSAVARRTCGSRKKVRPNGLADPARLQEARARWLGELAMQESKLERVSRPHKVAGGTSEVARRTCDARKKVSSHGLETWQGCKRHERGGSANLRCKKLNSLGLADPARLQEARARWLNELAVQESKLAWVRNLARLQEARARWLGELAVQEMKLARVSRLGKVARGTSEVARRTSSARNETRSDLERLQEARARRLGELAVQESKVERVSRPGKVARGTSEVALRTCGAGKQSCKRHERGGSANLRCKKVNSNGLADPARLQEARARWLGELTVQEMKLARVSDLARLQEARARWLGELAVQESILSRVSRPGKVARGTSEVALRTCGAGK
ncbi:hypothetical protein CRG98_009168 [Punica granatum]|uniref:Uncharacterized protein n=1 Tax=Punica granatum TaxID=22663 RepID=A0A2I0KPL7_PUNGR|nr:hypothetical protein CRG98_009168 [Punica granatum]